MSRNFVKRPNREHSNRRLSVTINSPSGATVPELWQPSTALNLHGHRGAARRRTARTTATENTCQLRGSDGARPPLSPACGRIARHFRRGDSEGNLSHASQPRRELRPDGFGYAKVGV